MADPGFPRGGGANSPGGRQHMILPIFPKNCMKSKEFGPRGGASLAPPLDPPLQYSEARSTKRVLAHTPKAATTFCVLRYRCSVKTTICCHDTHFYCPRTELWEGNVFSRVCLSFFQKDVCVCGGGMSSLRMMYWTSLYIPYVQGLTSGCWLHAVIGEE